MALVKFDSNRKCYNASNLPRIPDTWNAIRKLTEWFEFFKYDAPGDRWELKPSEVADRHYGVSFRMLYTIHDKRLYLMRESIFFALVGINESKEKQKTTYRFLKKFEPMKMSSVILYGGHLKPFVDVLVFKRLFKEKMDDSNGGRALRDVTELRMKRIRAAIIELERSVVLSGHECALTDDYALHLRARYGK